MSAQIRMEAEAKFPVWLTDGKTDYRAWAKRIAYRVERGDATVSLIQKQFATEALQAPPV